MQENKNKVTFHYAHYTRDFRKREVLVQDGTLAIEFRPYDIDNCFKTQIVAQMENIFLRVLHRLDISSRHGEHTIGFGAYDFFEISKDIAFNPNRIWQRELGRKLGPVGKGEGDFIRITTTFPSAIQERYAKEWNDYQDYLSTI